MEPIEQWKEEFESALEGHQKNKLTSGKYYWDHIEFMWAGFQRAKRSQPVVELPCIEICYDSKEEKIRHIDYEDLVYQLRSAGIQYRIKGE